jgi:hypothetical protein
MDGESAVTRLFEERVRNRIIDQLTLLTEYATHPPPWDIGAKRPAHGGL